MQCMSGHCTKPRSWPQRHAFIIRTHWRGGWGFNWWWHPWLGQAERGQHPKQRNLRLHPDSKHAFFSPYRYSKFYSSITSIYSSKASGQSPPLLSVHVDFVDRGPVPEILHETNDSSSHSVRKADTLPLRGGEDGINDQALWWMEMSVKITTRILAQTLKLPVRNGLSHFRKCWC